MAGKSVNRPAIPLLLLPGLHGTCDLLLPLAEHLVARRPVVPVDYPRDGMLGYAALTAIALARAPSGSFAVLAESFSGPIAIDLAVHEPRVMGLVLAATFARYPLPRPDAPAAAWLSGISLPPRQAAMILAGRGASGALTSELAALIATLPRSLVRHRVRIALAADARPQLARTTCPVLCLSGRRDRLTGRRALRSITGARPDAEVRRIDAGHMLLATHAGEAARHIALFLDR